MRPNWNLPIEWFVLRWHDSMPPSSKHTANQILKHKMRENQRVLDDMNRSNRRGDLDPYIREWECRQRRYGYALSRTIDEDPHASPKPG